MTDWATDHQLRTQRQVQYRIGQDQADGTQWMEFRSTNLFHLSCNCGYASGWVDLTTIDLAKIRTEHPYGQPIKWWIVQGATVPPAEPQPSKAQRYIGQPEWCCELAFLTLGKEDDDSCTRGQ